MSDSFDTPNDTDLENTAAEGERIAKVLARAGICSRRDAEKMIAAGRIALNGMILRSPAVNVGPDDQVSVDGEPLRAPQEVRLWRYHKPAGLVTTHKDPQGRTTVFTVLPRELPRVVSVGRLDLNSEGLLLLTNDGSLAGTLEHPSTAWARRYRVRVHGRVEESKLALLANGVEVEGVRYGPVEAIIERQQGANCWLQVTLHEGKNREVRRVMEHLGYTVNRLIRVSYGPFVIGRLQKGQVEEVPFKVLREALAGLGEAVPEELRMEKIDSSKWAKAKPRPVRPGYKKIVRARGGNAGDDASGDVSVTEARQMRPKHGQGGRDYKGFSRGGDDRSERSRDERPYGRSQEGGRSSGGPKRGEGKPGGRPFGKREDGDRPFGDRPQGGRPQGGRPQGGRPQGDRPQGGRPQGDRPQGGRPQGDRPQGGRPQGDRPQGDRPQGGRPQGDRPQGGRPQGDRPQGGRPQGGRPQGDRPQGGRPQGGRPQGDRPQGGRPQGGRPQGGRPQGGSRGGFGGGAKGKGGRG